MAVDRLAALQRVNHHQKHQVEHAGAQRIADGQVGASITVTALMPEASSGSEVTVASSARPI